MFRENEVSFPLLVFGLSLVAYAVLLTVYIAKKGQSTEAVNVKKLEQLIVYLKNVSFSGLPILPRFQTNDTFGYSSFPEPLTEDMWGQYCVRNGQAVNVPKIILVRGDLLLLRPGQACFSPYSNSVRLDCSVHLYR